MKRALKRYGMAFMLLVLAFVFSQRITHAHTVGQLSDIASQTEYFDVPGHYCGEFLPSAQPVTLSVADGRDWSPRVQLRTMGVSVKQPFKLLSDVQSFYFSIRLIIVLCFENYDIIYPYHCHW